MARKHLKAGALTAPLPPVLVTVGDMEKSNIITVAWTGILGTVPPKTYISVRPRRHSYNIIKESGEFVINLTTRELVRAAKESGTPLELNLLGMAARRHYPNEVFFEVAAEEGCPVILGMDAHAPQHVLKTELEEKAMEMVHRLGLNLLETVPLRSL